MLAIKPGFLWKSYNLLVNQIQPINLEVTKQGHLVLEPQHQQCCRGVAFWRGVVFNFWGGLRNSRIFQQNKNLELLLLKLCAIASIGGGRGIPHG